MSLEAAIEKLTASLDRNSAATEKSTDLMESAMNAAKAAAKGGTKVGTALATPDTSEPATTPATAPKKTAGRPTKPKAVTQDDLRTAAGNYLRSGPGGAKKEPERKENLRAMAQHFGVEQVTKSDPSNWTEAMGYLKQLQDGETPSFMNEEAAEEEGESPI